MPDVTLTFIYILFHLGRAMFSPEPHKKNGLEKSVKQILIHQKFRMENNVQIIVGFFFCIFVSAQLFF